MLFACLRFPSLALDVFTRARAPDAATPRSLVIASGGHAPQVVAADAAARAAGLRPGMTIAAALALAPDILLRDRDPAAEDRALAQLATRVLQFTPATSLAPPDALVADLDGSLRLFGGLARLRTRLEGELRAQGYALDVGIAPTPLAARLLARAAPSAPVLDRAALPAALRALPLALGGLDPVAYGGLDPKLLDTLAGAGITTCGQAAALPRDALARRCGSAFVAWLDRAYGRAADPLRPFVPPPCFESRLDLPVPVADHDALAFAVNRLVHELSAWLLARGLGASRLALELRHEHYLRQRGLAPTELDFALGAPARAPAHLLGVLRERLARARLPAPVETIVLRSVDTAPLAGRNLGLLPGDEAEAATVPLLDRLRARLGDDAIVRIAPQAEHRPEHAMGETLPGTMVSPRSGSGAPRRTEGVGASLRSGPAGGAPRPGSPDHPPLPDAPRPLWLLAEPQPLGHVLEHEPWALKDGPERIESGWWDGGDLRRDYFVAVTRRGETVWIYRDHRYGIDDGEWFLHGLFA